MKKKPRSHSLSLLSSLSGWKACIYRCGRSGNGGRQWSEERESGTRRRERENVYFPLCGGIVYPMGSHRSLRSRNFLDFGKIREFCVRYYPWRVRVIARQDSTKGIDHITQMLTYRLKKTCLAVWRKHRGNYIGVSFLINFPSFKKHTFI